MGVRASQTTIYKNFLEFPNGTHDFYVCLAGKNKVITHLINTSWALPAKLIVSIGPITKKCRVKYSSYNKKTP